MNIFLYIVLFVTGIIVGAAIVGGSSHTYDGISINEAARIFTDNGLPAIRKTSTEGEPYLGSNVSGSDFETHFYRCTGDNKDEKCEDMALFASYPVRNAVLEPFNYWNGKSRVAKAYLNDPKTLAYLRIDIHAKGGVTKAQLDYYVESWKVFMPQFYDYLRTGRL